MATNSMKATLETLIPDHMIDGTAVATVTSGASYPPSKSHVFDPMKLCPLFDAGAEWGRGTGIPDDSANSDVRAMSRLAVSQRPRGAVIPAP